jgi:4-hydroxybenzoate polyprenyltransferase
VSELLKKLFWSSRPVSWINTAYPFAAAYFFNTHKLDDVFWVGTLFFLIPYNLLMYGINDVFDYESDLRNPRKGGIEGALLDPKFHRPTLLVSTLLPVPFVVFLVARGSLASDLWLALFLFTVVAYSAKGLRFKEKPLLDSITSASHFVGPMIVGLAMAGFDFGSTSALAVTFAFTLWGIASHAFGAVQDVKADREANISSIATYFGARTTTRFAWFAYLAAGLLMLTTGWPSLIASVAAVPYLAIVAPHWNITDETCESANAGWKNFIWLNYIAGFVVTMLLIYEFWISKIL